MQWEREFDRMLVIVKLPLKMARSHTSRGDLLQRPLHPLQPRRAIEMLIAESTGFRHSNSANHVLVTCLMHANAMATKECLNWLCTSTKNKCQLIHCMYFEALWTVAKCFIDKSTFSMRQQDAIRNSTETELPVDIAHTHFLVEGL